MHRPAPQQPQRRGRISGARPSAPSAIHPVKSGERPCIGRRRRTQAPKKPGNSQATDPSAAPPTILIIPSSHRSHPIPSRMSLILSPAFLGQDCGLGGSRLMRVLCTLLLVGDTGPLSPCVADLRVSCSREAEAGGLFRFWKTLGPMGPGNPAIRGSRLQCRLPVGTCNQGRP